MQILKLDNYMRGSGSGPDSLEKKLIRVRIQPVPLNLFQYIS